MASIYLDYNATCPIKPQICAVVAQTMGDVGNPSSQHGAGRHARSLVEDARQHIATALNHKASGVIFVSSGTEADNLALCQVHALGDEAPLWVSPMEHEAIRAYCPDRQRLLPFDAKNGQVNLEALAQALAQHQDTPGLISLQLVSSETGLIQPVAAVANLARQHGWLLHCDAVQGLGKVAIDFADLGVHMMTISAHKMGGPQGVAALLVEPNLHMQPLIKGGGQERNRRSGTENVAGIVGFGEAMKCLETELLRQDLYQVWRDQAEDLIMRSVPEAQIVGRGMGRVANTLCLIMPKMVASAQLMNFDLKGFCVSAGSACSSGKAKASPSLLALGLNAESAGRAIRASWGWNSQETEVKQFCQTWIELARRA